MLQGQGLNKMGRGTEIRKNLMSCSTRWHRRARLCVHGIHVAQMQPEYMGGALSNPAEATDERRRDMGAPATVRTLANICLNFLVFAEHQEDQGKAAQESWLQQ